MKGWFAGLVAACLACAVPMAACAAEPSRLLGAWAVDVSQLPMPPEARPKRVTFSFDEADAGNWTIRVEIVQADGSERVSNATVALDGATARIEGDTLEADAIAARRASADVLVVALGKGGAPASTRVYTVAPDGTRMVETAVYFDAHGKAVMRSFPLVRIPPEARRKSG